MIQAKQRRKFDYNFLVDFCKEHEIKLLKEYQHQKVSRDTIIDAKQKNNVLIHKTFRQLVDCPNITVQIYDYHFLVDFCTEHDITLLKEYKGEKITRDTIIEAKQKNSVLICKTFRQLVECQNINVQIYDYHFLMSFCKEHEITLLKDYKNEKITRNTVIHAKCTFCDEQMISKTFQNLVESKNTGCLTHHKIIKQKKILIKWNVKYPAQSKEIQEKMQQTNIIKYGFRFPMQYPEFAEKALKNTYASIEYQFPSGRIDKVQGYEPFALDDLLFKEQLDENDIITAKNKVPNIWYKDDDDQDHRYYVDIYIPSQKRCIEVKSVWTFEQDQDVVFLKQQAMIDAGYNCNIWVYNAKREIVDAY